MADQNSIREKLVWAGSLLENHSSSARLDSEVLLAHCLGKDRSYLLTWPEKELTVEESDSFKELIRLRLEPQPVAYLIGHREFYSMDFITTSDTLVPRPETEMLVDTVLELVSDIGQPRILELGTGTGVIAVALKKHKPEALMMATDFSRPALQVAQSNAQQHDLKIEFVESNWYMSLDAGYRFDVIVSNPPYIAQQDPYLTQGDLTAEPQLALCSGITGLEAIHTIIEGAKDFLKPGGWLVLEHGYDQQQTVSDLFQKSGYRSLSSHKDFNDLPRMSLACYP